MSSAVPSLIERLKIAWNERAIALKAVSFASIGVINVIVNYTVFWIMLRMTAQEPVRGWLTAVSEALVVSYQDVEVVAANVVAWLVAMSGSYVMNSYITFAAESGRKLTWRAYLTFAASGVLGLLADTGAVLAAMRVFPIMIAKLAGIGAGFVVNFSMSHFVVFRPRSDAR